MKMTIEDDEHEMKRNEKGRGLEGGDFDVVTNGLLEESALNVARVGQEMTLDE